MQPDAFFEQLWRDYLASTPSARRIRDLLEARGEVLVNDHIALRTFDHPRVDIGRLASIFLAWGYREAPDRYTFEAKKLRARHYEHPQGLPRIFISELATNAFSSTLRGIVESCIAAIPRDMDILSLYLADTPWTLSGNDYERLAAESEYAAWVGAFGYRPNHFTVSVNHLQTFADLPALNAFLTSHGFALNGAGGEIKGSPRVGLEQSSTLADRVRVDFADGPRLVPSCYYEFARRYPLDPRQPNRLYQGFVTASADRIFESTDRGH